MVSERDSAVEHLPVGNEELQKQAAQPFPQVFRAALLFPRRPEQRATALLHLINQEGEHRQLGEHRRQMLFAVAEVVFEAIALVLQGVESLVFDAPPGAARTHQRLGVHLGEDCEAVSGHGKGLPLLQADVSGLSRLWLGCASADVIATSGEISGPQELLDALDRTLSLPLPKIGWQF